MLPIKTPVPTHLLQRWGSDARTQHLTRRYGGRLDFQAVSLVNLYAPDVAWLGLKLVDQRDADIHIARKMRMMEGRGKVRRKLNIV
jgi:hypothetical protein